MYEYYASYVRTVDGDTAVCNIDVGFHMTINDVTLRFLRINTPEISKKDPGALEAKNFTLKWFERNKKFIVKTFEKDAFGRWLSEVYSISGTNLNDLLLEKGLAVPFTK